MRILDPRLALGLLLLLAGASACGGCKGKKEAGPDLGPAALLPATTPRAAVVTDLARLGAALGALEKTKLAGLAAAAAGKETAAELVAPVVRQLGFDPRTPEGIAQAGIDGQRGIAVGEDAGTQLLVLPVADAGKLDAYLGALALRAGGPAVKDAPLPGGAVAKAYGDPAGPPRLAYATFGRFAVMAQGGDPVAALTRAAALTPEASLAKSPAFLAAQAKLGARDVVVWSAAGAHAFPGAPEAGGVAGASIARTGLSIRGLLPQKPETLAALKPLGQPAGADLVPLLPPESFLAFRLGGDPSALQPFVESLLPERLLARLKKAGVDLRTDVLAQLKPGVVVGVGLSKDIDLSGGLPSGDGFSVNETNPFRFVNVTLYARVKDPAAARAVLDRIAKVGEELRFEVTSKQQDGVTVWTSRYVAGEGMTWTLSGETLVATGGKDAFPRALVRLKTPQPPFAIGDAPVKAAFDQAASAAYLDMPRLTTALKGIPEFAYGVGGFRIKQVVETWVTMLEEVKGLAATFSVDDGGVVVDAELSLK